MKIISFLIVIILGGANLLSAQDAQVVLHESMLNKFLKAGNAVVRLRLLIEGVLNKRLATQYLKENILQLKLR